MRIGTWNLDGRWDTRHLDLLQSLDCDVLLLTEVAERAAVPGYVAHPTSEPMLPGKHWAAVLARVTSRSLPDPHGAAAMAEVDGVRCVASVLPWRGCAPFWPGPGTDTTERTRHAVDAIVAARPTIWGGDWNHSMDGPELAGTVDGREAIQAALRHLGLQAPTRSTPHQSDGVLSIDHIAIPGAWNVAGGVEHHRAVHAGRRLSDHDLYVVDTQRPSA